MREANERKQAVLDLVEQCKASAIFFNNLYDPISLVSQDTLQIFRTGRGHDHAPHAPVN